jgi:hypothetical protein
MNYVVVVARLDRADRQHGGLMRIDRAGQDQLVLDDRQCRHDHGISGEMRQRAVAADALEADVELLGSGLQHARPMSDEAGAEWLRVRRARTCAPPSSRRRRG